EMQRMPKRISDSSDRLALSSRGHRHNNNNTRHTDTPERDRRYCPDCRPESRVPGQRILCGGAEPELPVRRKIDRPAWSDASRNYVMPTAPGEKIRIAHGLSIAKSNE